MSACYMQVYTCVPLLTGTLLVGASLYSCYCSTVCSQIFFCLEMHTNKAKGSIQSRIDLFTLSVCKTTDNCDNSDPGPG